MVTEVSSDDASDTDARPWTSSAHIASGAVLQAFHSWLAYANWQLRGEELTVTAGTHARKAREGAVQRATMRAAAVAQAGVRVASCGW